MVIHSHYLSFKIKIKEGKKMVEKTSFSFKGWNLARFIKGRKKLLITIVGAISTFLITNDPVLSGVVGGVTELIYAIIEYYVKEEVSP